MKTLRIAIMTVVFSCLVHSIEVMADNVFGSSTLVYDVANNKVRGYSRTELDYNTAAYYTAYVCGELYKNGVSQVRACQSGFMTASINTQFTGTSFAASITTDHYVDMQNFDEVQQSYVDYFGYSFLPGYTYPLEWLFDAPNIFANHYPVSIRLGSTDVACNCQCSNRPTDADWNELSPLFPGLKRCQVCILAGESETYNCLSWVIDDLSRVYGTSDVDTITVNGLIDVQEMNAFLQSKGKSNIWYYGPATSNLAHVAKKAGGGGDGCLATSKLGQLHRIAHHKDQLQGTSYGNIVGGN